MSRESGLNIGWDHAPWVARGGPRAAWGSDTTDLATWPVQARAWGFKIEVSTFGWLAGVPNFWDHELGQVAHK